VIGKSEILDRLAHCGLLFMAGEPPKTEDGVLILWTGGCNAVLGMWDERQGAWVGFPNRKPLVDEFTEQPDTIHCWMRLPHPSFWPEIQPPTQLIEERALYSAEGDVFEAMKAGEAA
jgi:hypothetical protein